MPTSAPMAPNVGTPAGIAWKLCFSMVKITIEGRPWPQAHVPCGDSRLDGARRSAVGGPSFSEDSGTALAMTRCRFPARECPNPWLVGVTTEA